MAEIIQIRDYHLRRLEIKAADIKAKLIEFAKTGAPIVEGATPVDHWAERHSDVPSA